MGGGKRIRPLVNLTHMWLVFNSFIYTSLHFSEPLSAYDAISSQGSLNGEVIKVQSQHLGALGGPRQGQKRQGEDVGT